MPAAGREDFSYFNFLELLTAYLPVVESPYSYTANSAKWCKALFKLREEYGDEYPDLFQDIYFTQRKPADPYSAQVSEFFSKCGLTIHNPVYERMEITEEKRLALKATSEKPLQRYKEIIAKMATNMALQIRDKAEC